MRYIPLLLFMLLGGCTSLFYQPSRQQFYKQTPQSDLVPEDIYFQSPGGPKLHAWFFKSRKEPAKATVIQFHGNAENLTSHFLSVVWLVNYGYNVFAFDYRGYGQSEGTAYPEGVHADSIITLDKAWELAGKKEKSLIVYGQSLGGVTSLRTLEEWPHTHEAVRNIVIESSFLSYQKIAREKLNDHWQTWALQWLAYPLVTDTYNPARKLKTLAPVPILIIHGDADTIVPVHHGKEIFKAASEPKCLWIIHGCEHIQSMSVEKGIYRQKLIEYLENGKCG